MIELNKLTDTRGSSVYHVYPGTESEQYDFTAERQLIHGTNLFESTAHLIKGCLGAGILSIHVGYMHAGIWTATVVTILIGLLLLYTMTILIKAAQILYVRLRVPRLSYPDLAEAALVTGPFACLRKCGKAFRYVVDVCLLAEMCGSCCIYEIMIAKTMKQFLEAVSPSIREIDWKLQYYLLIISVPLILLSLIRNLKYLAPFSFIADIFIAICVLITIYYSLIGVGRISDRLAWKSFDGLINFCGVCLYSMDGLTVMLSVENNMKKPKYFFIVLQYAWLQSLIDFDLDLSFLTGMAIVVLMLICTGLFGYWGWGEHCRSPIIIHMPANVVSLILQFLIVLMLGVTFALHFWVPFRVIWYYVGKRHNSKRVFWERFYRMLLVLLITGISVSFPYLIRIMIFGSVTQMELLLDHFVVRPSITCSMNIFLEVGNFFLAWTAIIFPVVIETLVTWTEYSSGAIRWTLFRNVLIILVGVMFCCGAFYTEIDV